MAPSFGASFTSGIGAGTPCGHVPCTDLRPMVFEISDRLRAEVEADANRGGILLEDAERVMGGEAPAGVAYLMPSTIHSYVYVSVSAAGLTASSLPQRAAMPASASQINLVLVCCPAIRVFCPA